MEFRLIHYDTIDSTNSEAWRLVKAGAIAGTTIIAKEQTAGRGQRGNTWLSPAGGLYLSVIWQLPIPAAWLGQITLCMAWGVVTALRETGAAVRLKWPNDLVIDGYKLGGILTETKVEQDLVTTAIIGIGINWLNPVPEHGISLRDIPTNLTNLEALTAVVLAGVQQGSDRLTQALAHPQSMLRHMQEWIPAYLELLSDRHITWQGKQGEIVDITIAGDLVIKWHDDHELSVYKAGMISLGYSA